VSDQLIHKLLQFSAELVKEQKGAEGAEDKRQKAGIRFNSWQLKIKPLDARPLPHQGLSSLAVRLPSWLHDKVRTPENWGSDVEGFGLTL
jgi:hypothetical protein